MTDAPVPDRPAVSISIPGDIPGDPGPRWRLRFYCVFGGQALSLVGSALTQFVLLWWITDTTGSATALGLAGMAILLPGALLGPLGGTLADRLSRRGLMIGADLVSALTLGALVALFASGGVELWHVYVAMALRSAMQAVQQPAAAASTAMLVPTAFVPRAAGMNQAVYGLMAVGAAPLGATAMALLPLEAALSIDIVTALVALVPLAMFRIPQPRRPATTEEAAGGAAPGVWTDLREGVRVVWRDPGLVRLYGLMALVVAAILPTFTMTPLFVKEHFGGGAGEVALMEGLSGLGMLVGGGLAVAFVAPRPVRRVLWTFALSCAAVTLAAAAPPDMFSVAVAGWVLSGWAYAFGNAPLTALLQTRIPNHLQGRVLALLNTVVGLAAPVGLAAAAPLAEAFGVRAVFAGAGVVSALVCLAGYASRPLLALDDAPVVIATKPSDPALSA